MTDEQISFETFELIILTENNEACNLRSFSNQRIVSNQWMVKLMCIAFIITFRKDCRSPVCTVKSKLNRI